MSPAPQPKAGQLRCEVTLAWTRLQPCRECVERSLDPGGDVITVPRAAGEAHHFPVKGMGGAHIRDDMVIPLCRAHHEDAQAYRIPASTQIAWTHENRCRFLDSAPAADVQAYVAALMEWKARAFASSGAVPW